MSFYVASLCVTRQVGGTGGTGGTGVVHAVCIWRGDSADEARDKMLAEFIERYPLASGWKGHTP